ncbi:winged helix-turn-helix domain-containing protein [Halorubellus litoreus]|uniref:Helix-turn-helix transcriptional regulator n=1 Tax=Halorubellus litoreus TaxID=755308 RepID=A0ABD5V7X4_9EURY
MPERAVDTGRETEPATESSPPTDELLRALAKSRTLVRSLRDGPKYKRTLAEDLDVSKSTVYNWARELNEHGVVARTHEGYELTALGAQVAAVFQMTVETTEHLYEARPLLEAVPESMAPPPCVMATASVVTTDTSPTAPLDAFMTWVEDATHVTGLPGLTYPRSFEAVADDLRSGDMTCDVVIENDDVDALTAKYPAVCEQVLAGPSTVHYVDETPPVGLYLLPDSTPNVGVTTYTDRGHIASFVRLSGEDAATWARGVYEDVRKDATLVDSQ